MLLERRNTGFENWKTDLLRFVAQDFHDSLNSSDRKEQTEADQELALWINTTDISFLFRGTWGDKSDNRSKSLQCLHNAQILERKFDDQYIIQAINRAIRTYLKYF